ncbi:MAG: flagellar hook-length control protein FliK [Candidatus Adiutrix sp.]
MLSAINNFADLDSFAPLSGSENKGKAAGFKQILSQAMGANNPELAPSLATVDRGFIALPDNTLPEQVLRALPDNTLPEEGLRVLADNSFANGNLGEQVFSPKSTSRPKFKAPTEGLGQEVLNQALNFAPSENANILTKIDFDKLIKNLSDGQNLSGALRGQGAGNILKNPKLLGAIQNSFESLGLGHLITGSGESALDLPNSAGEFSAQNQLGAPRFMVNSLLHKNKLEPQGGPLNDTGFSFKRGFLGADIVKESLALSGADLPLSYKNQIGRGLMAMGQMGSSVNSMKAGADLLGCRTPLEALNSLLGDLKGELSLLKLNPKGLAALGEVMGARGLGTDRINETLAPLSDNSMTLEQVFFQTQKLAKNFDNSGGGLIATEDGLSKLGQFFNSLGASTEMVRATLDTFKPGDEVTAAALRALLTNFDDGSLAPTLSEAEAFNFKSLLQSMGARPSDIDTLSTILRNTQGKLSINGFLDFLEGMEKAPAQTMTSQDLEMVKAVLQNINREQQLAKTPVFDEILIKLTALGDRETDKGFKDISPALQALRGGIVGQKNAGGSPGGQMDWQQNSQNKNQESQQQFREAIYGQTTEIPKVALEVTESVQNYGGQESLARQISQKLAYSNRRGIHRLRMNLNPNSLGKINIELKLRGDQLTAHIRAESREAYEALTADAHELKQALLDSGLEISNMTISFGDNTSKKVEFADLRHLWGGDEVSDENLAGASALDSGRSNTHQDAIYHVV